MKFAESITRHALLIVIIWIILASISAPALLELNKVTMLRPEKLMPNATESTRANEILANIMRESMVSTALAYDIVIVKGVNASDPRLVDIDQILNRSINEYVTYYVSPYSIFKTIYGEIDRGIRNYTENIYDYMNQTYHILLILRDNKHEIITWLNMSHSLTHFLIKYYNSVYENLSSYEHLAKEIYSNLSSLPETYMNLSKTYNDTVEQIQGINGFLILVKYMLIIGDSFYSSILGNLSEIYINMTFLNHTIQVLNHMFYNTSLEYTLTLYDILRIHYYLLYNTSAYTKGLNKLVIDELINYTRSSGFPVEPSIINKTYYYVVEVYGVDNISIETLYVIASNIYWEDKLKPYIPPEIRSFYISFLSIYNKTLLNTSTSILVARNTSYVEILFNNTVQGQLDLLDHLLEARGKALPTTVQLYADHMACQMITDIGLPSDAYPYLYYMIISAYNAGYPLNSTVLEDLVVNAMYNMTILYSNVSAPYVLKQLYHEIYRSGPVREVVDKILPIFLNETFPQSSPEIISIISNTIIENDPRGTYLFVYNETLTLDYVARIVSNTTGLPYDILYGLVNETINPYEATYLLLSNIIVNTTGIEEMRDVIHVIYMCNGVVSYEGFLEIFKILVSPMFFEKTWYDTLVFGVDDNITKYMDVFIQYLAFRVWNKNLTLEYMRRLLIGTPLVIVSIALSNNTRIIDRILYGSPVINALLNNTYQTRNYSLIIKTITYIMIISNNTLIVPGLNNMFNNTGFPIDNVLEKIAELPENVSIDDLVGVLAYAFPIPVRDNYVNASVLREKLSMVLIDVIVREADPLNVLSNLIPYYNVEDLDNKIIQEYLVEALREDNPLILYNGLTNYLYNKLFLNITSSLKGRMISEDMRVFLIIINPRGEDEEEKAENAYKVVDIVRNILVKQGFNPEYVGVVGDNILGFEIKKYSREDIERIQLISMIGPVLIALIIIGGLLVTALPFLGIVASVTVSSGIIYLLACLDIISITSWSRMLMITTAFGLGMDYTSYIVLRFKEKLPQLRDPSITAQEALRYSFPAIIAAATTDIIGFAVMKLAWEFPLLASIGESVPIAIFVVLIVSLTLTPALLALFGDKKWFWWPHKIETGRRVWRGFKLTRRRAMISIFLALILLSIGVYGLSIFKGSHDYIVFVPENSIGYNAYQELLKYFPAGKLMPIYIVYVLRENYSVYDQEIWHNIREIRSELLKINGVYEVYGPTYPGDKSCKAYIGVDNKTFYLEIIVKPSPLSREGIELTREIRDYVKKHVPSYYREVLVGGLPASSLEMEDLLNNVFWQRVFPVAFILMWFAMSLCFTSLWSGLIALSTIIIGYLLGVILSSSIASIYDQPILWFLPLMTLPAVLGVGMDYNSFFMNRQRYEFRQGLDSYKASSTAISRVSHLVLGLGLIVTVSYAGLITGSSWGVRELGIALSTAVFTTTIMSSIFLTPAVLALTGKKAWWPGCKRWGK